MYGRKVGEQDMDIEGYQRQKFGDMRRFKWITKDDDSPSLKCLMAIAKALGCSVKELILEE